MRHCQITRNAPPRTQKGGPLISATRLVLATCTSLLTQLTHHCYSNELYGLTPKQTTPTSYICARHSHSCSQICQDSHLVCQQQVSDLSQILLGEDKSHISFNVGQEPVKSQIDSKIYEQVYSLPEQPSFSVWNLTCLAVNRWRQV